jgi:hypothetical protein
VPDTKLAKADQNKDLPATYFKVFAAYFCCISSYTGRQNI